MVLGENSKRDTSIFPFSEYRGEYPSSRRCIMKHSSTERYLTKHDHFVDPPRPASRFDSGSGNGTIMRWPPGKTLEHPILDGATQSREAEHDVENPWRGVSDPGLIVHPWRVRTHKHRWFWE